MDYIYLIWTSYSAGPKINCWSPVQGQGVYTAPKGFEPQALDRISGAPRKGLYGNDAPSNIRPSHGVSLQDSSLPKKLLKQENNGPVDRQEPIPAPLTFHLAAKSYS